MMIVENERMRTMYHNIGNFIANKRKELGMTQQKLAEQLNVSFQAVSKWETGATVPDALLLPQLAHLLQTSVDALVGYKQSPITDYEKKYEAQEYYWGILPNSICYEIMKRKPPVRPYKVLDMGCGEGKDAVFLAKNGYVVTAFDASEKGLEKAKELARQNHVEVNFFKADINEYEPVEEYDIIFSSGTLHYLSLKHREKLIQSIKEYTSINGLHALNVFLKKPFVEAAPDSEEKELLTDPWYSGELMRYYHDWMFHSCEEIIFDCNSGGIPHKHCMQIVIAEKLGNDQ